MRRSVLIFAVLTFACDAGVTADDAVPLPAPGKADAVGAGLPMITEYTEPAVGNDKAIELYNPLPFAVSMDDCAVEVYFNGRTEGRRIPLTGLDMDAEGTAVICHGGAQIDGCDVRSNNLAFNGNDAVALRCDFGGTQPRTLDVLGVVGEDPGSEGWEVDGHSTRDVALRRSCGVANGHDTFEPAQWEAAAAGDVSDLGEYTPCDPVLACRHGEDILGADADAIFHGGDARFEVVASEIVFGGFTPRVQELLLAATQHAEFPDEVITDAASVVGAVARDGTGGIESFSIRDNDSGLLYDAVRYFANDATEHSVVFLADGDEVAFSFDGELFGCDGTFCNDGDLTLPVFEGVDENFEPTERFTVVDHQVVLGASARAHYVFHRGDEPALLDTAFRAHHLDDDLGDLNSIEALEAVARDYSGPITYAFLEGPTETLEGIVFNLGPADYGVLVAESSFDPELMAVGGEVTYCAP